MNKFTILRLDLQVPHKPRPDGLYELTDDYIVSWIYKGVTRTIRIRRGFIWDGASVPRLFWTILGFYPGGIMLPCSLPHDDIYINKGIMIDDSTGEFFKMTRKECDLLFKAHMEYVGMPQKKLNRAYLGVKYFGWLYWNDVIKFFKRK